MKRSATLPSAVILVALVAAACGVSPLTTQGSGELLSEDRTVSGFNEIVLATAGDVFVTVGENESLRVEAQENLLPLLTTEVRSGRLELRSDGAITPTEDIVYTITVVALEAVTISGSGDIEASDLDTATFDATISGSGSASLQDANLDLLDVEISGSGDVRAAGAGDTVEVVISGSGEFDGERFQAKAGFVTVSGSGSVVVNASDQLDVRINGSGDVEYLGDPALTVETPGSGEISRR